MPAGGYQPPKNPATFSAPGKYSQRTDGGPMDSRTQGAPRITGLPYGENKDLNNLQSAQPLASSNLVTPTPPPINLEMLTGMRSQAGFASLEDGDDNPDIPLSAGMPFGEGSNVLPDITPLIEAPIEDKISSTLRATFAEYPSPGLYNLIQKLEQEGR